MSEVRAAQGDAASPRWRRWLLDPLRQPEGTPSYDRKTLTVLLATPILLTLLWYYGRLPFYREVVAPYLNERYGLDRADSDLIGYYHLAAVSVITRLLIPMGLIWFVFRDRLSNYGFRLRGTGTLWRIYLGLLLFMLPVLYFASGLESFQGKYPLYDYAARSLPVFLTYELSYILVFLSGEAFWRGFMAHALAPRFGLYGLVIMSIPYAMIHFGKPAPETLGAIVTGLVLGYLSLKHRSFWLGVALHSTIGISMDVICLWRKGLLWQLFT